jgi:hypothetical protein
MDTFRCQSFPWAFRSGHLFFSNTLGGVHRKDPRRAKAKPEVPPDQALLTNLESGPGWGCGSSYTEGRRS